MITLGIGATDDLTPFITTGLEIGTKGQIELEVKDRTFVLIVGNRTFDLDEKNR